MQIAFNMSGEQTIFNIEVLKIVIGSIYQVLKWKLFPNILINQQ